MLSWLSGRRDDIETLVARRQFAKAIRLLESRLQDDPENLALRQQLADVLARDGQTGRAVALLGELVEALAREGAVAKGLAVLKKIERLDPEVRVDDKLLALSRAREERTSRPDDPPFGSEDSQIVAVGGDESSSVRSGVAFATSELVLSDWVEEAEQRDDFNWSPLLSGLSEAEMNAVFGDLRMVVKYPGAIIYSAGEPAAGLFVLANGSARIYRPDATGRQRQLALVRGGDFFGVDAVLVGGRRRHTVTAATECEILQIDQGLFERLADRHPHIRQHVEKIGRELGLEPG